ncbi:MAG: LuxR C-terminal-related transcriptional regulator [Ardenticatenaceae bacterium]
MNITVLILNHRADTHPIGPFLAHEPEIELIAELADCDRFLARAVKTRPTIALLDFDRPAPEECLTLIVQMRLRRLATRTLLWGTVTDESLVLPLLEAGAEGFVQRENVPSRLVAALQAVAGGDSWLGPTISAQFLAWGREMRRETYGLSQRELEVLRAVGRGLSNKEIARALGIRDNTAKFHIGNIYKKLDLYNRVEVVVWAIQHGLLGESEAE